MFVVRISYLIGAKLQQSFLFTNACHSYFKAIEHLFYEFYRHDKTTWDVRRTLEKLVNHSPAARDLQAFLVFSQHLAWVYHAGKRIEKVFYCLNRTQNSFIFRYYYL